MRASIPWSTREPVERPGAELVAECAVEVGQPVVELHVYTVRGPGIALDQAPPTMIASYIG